MYSIQGLWTAAQRELPIAFVIIKNSGYDALGEFGEHFGMTELPGVRLPGLDFCELARGQGMPAMSVTRGEDLDAALMTAFESRSPMLVEVSVEGIWRNVP
jgi:benzoylformate decarboxylase